MNSFKDTKEKSAIKSQRKLQKSIRYEHNIKEVDEKSIRRFKRKVKY